VYLAGKGVYGFLTGSKVQAAFAKKSSSFPFRASVFPNKNLTALKPTPEIAHKTTTVWS
jgi:hypothetical protein